MNLRERIGIALSRNIRLEEAIEWAAALPPVAVAGVVPESARRTGAGTVFA